MKFYDRPVVELIRAAADDHDVIRAAQVSVKGENNPAEMEPARRRGLIGYLARNRHGSPFEHTSFTWFVKAPIFAVREMQRHRIASFNETSGRYRALEPEFYVPADDRPLVNAGSGAHPKLVAGDYDQLGAMVISTRSAYASAWEAYEEMRSAGIANEVARQVLPVGIMTSLYVTMNARALTNFLSLRTDDEAAEIPSKPQLEIEMIAREFEKDFAAAMPLTHEAWHENGRRPL